MSAEKQSLTSYKDKMQEANREALISLVGLGIIIVAWLIGGFGLASLDISLAGLPLWVIGGTFLPWIVSIVLAVLFATKLFRNFDLNGEDGEETHE